MRWRGRRQSTNVSDQRGHTTGGDTFRLPGSNRTGDGNFRIPRGRPTKRASCGLGLGTLAIIGVVLFFLGVNPLTILGQLGGGLGGGLDTSVNPNVHRKPITRPKTRTPANDEMKQFVSTILASTEQVWTGVMKAYGKRYPKPDLVLFEGSVRSACGFASSASGPFYCPGDSKIYIDLSFYDQLATEFKAKGDFAQAYVLAHEVGHHIQNIIGILPQFNRERQRLGKIEANRKSVKVELQADCFAGVWGYYVEREGWLEKSDLREALNAASKIGDDAIQKRTTGRIVPESFNHGTSKQRVEWFSRGFKNGRLESCNSFN